MTDKPVRDSLVKNANVTSDLHIACRAENERLRGVLEAQSAVVEAARSAFSANGKIQPLARRKISDALAALDFDRDNS